MTSSLLWNVCHHALSTKKAVQKQKVEMSVSQERPEKEDHVHHAAQELRVKSRLAAW